MIRKELELTSEFSSGFCRAVVTDGSVSIKTHGVFGCLKAWLVGKEENLELGNLVNGMIEKKVDTSPYSGILITQSGRQVFYGAFRETPEPGKEIPEAAAPEEENTQEKIFSFDDGYSWRTVTDRKYPSDSLTVRYILSHRSFYNAFLLHGKYFYGEKDTKAAIAIECDIKNEPHPFPQLSGYSVLREGYLIICADTAAKNFCEYEY